MAKNFEHVSHIKSKLTKENINPEEFYGLIPTVDNSDAEGSSPIKVKFPKLPTEDKLIEGEIAVNYLKGHETLSIKNSEKEIVGFVNENEFFQAQEIISSALGQEKNDRIESITKIEEKLALKANSADLATVATSGSYNDLKDKPVIPEGAVVDVALSDTSENPVQNKVVKAAIDAKQDVISDLETIRSGAARGATSYQKPSTGIPASDIANGVIPTVPTNVSAFTNDAGYLTQHQSLDNYYTKDDVYSKTESDKKYATQVVVNEEIAAAVGPLATKEEMNAVDAKFANYATADALNTEVQRATAAESNLQSKVTAEQTRAEAKEAELKAAIEDLSNNSETQVEKTNAKFVEVNQKIDDNELVISAALNDLNASIIKHNDETYTKQEVNNLTSNFFDKAEYVSQTKRINFYDKDGNIVSYIDATDFIKDGMVSNVAISESNLVITFNTDAGKEPISIALTDIFNTANYYDKTAMDGKLALKADASNVYTKSEADSKFLTEHQSLEKHYTKLQVDNQFDEIEYTVSASLNDLNTRIEELSNNNTNQFTAIDERMTYFDEGIDDLELIVSSSLNDLNTRVETNLSTINSLLNKIDELTQRVTALEAKTSAG